MLLGQGDAALKVMDRFLPAAWESAAGYIGLRDVLADRTRGATGRAVDRHGVMVTSGAAQALALIFEAFVDPGDAVAIEAPTWNSALAMPSVRSSKGRDGKASRRYWRPLSRSP